jgi:hypothetical protein
MPRSGKASVPSAAFWNEALARVGVPSSPINTPSQLLDHPHTRGSGMIAIRPVCLKGWSAGRLHEPEFPDLVGRQAEFAGYFVGSDNGDAATLSGRKPSYFCDSALA